MASVQHFIEDAEQIIDELLQLEAIAEAAKPYEYKAARTIQRWYRGFKQRKHIEKLNQYATTMQRYIRGFLARLEFRRHVQRRYIELVVLHYHRCATLIQKVWRGYISRKNIFNYFKLQTWLRTIEMRNNLMRIKMQYYREDTHDKIKDAIEDECQQWVLFILFKLHHLIRTAVCKGIYSKTTQTTQLSRIEELMHSLKYTDYMKQLRKEYIEMYKKRQPRKLILKGRLARCERFWNEKNLDEYNVSPQERGKEFKGKRFILSTKILIDKSPISFGPYTEPIRCVVRNIEPEKHVSQNRYNTFSWKYEEFSNYINYYIDYWDRLICDEHFIQNPYAVKQMRNKLSLPS